MSSDKDESSSNDSQDSASSYFSHSSSAHSQHSRASSATSYSSYDNQPKALRSLRDSATITSRRTSSLLSAPRTSWYQNVFRKLPAEVVGCIVSHLEIAHMEEKGTPQSFVKDLHSLSLTSRVWDRHVRQHLYVYYVFTGRTAVLIPQQIPHAIHPLLGNATTVEEALLQAENKTEVAAANTEGTSSIGTLCQAYSSA